ncbi:PLP-dependent aminotransferase family protein [Alkalihalobacterium alkalinitrilicum]|uniref:MocR-like pyridoxine biosynthesis transcription factor PdxR n=1 Tax=Alkalihalobacterium alkalinitrilicum TaxID=427920 RepID=UPI0009959F67|nr:PLP-dependent aminotransferase family protein [Alkalihalobacterium alkalinitrilicum]
MNWVPNRAERKPIYKQIAEYIENEISLGNYPPNSVLPSERELAKGFSVNRSTIVAAYDELESVGLVVRIKGSGTKVSGDIWGLLNKRIPNWNKYVEEGSFPPNFPIVQRLRQQTQENDLINFVSGELSSDLFPTEKLQHIMTSVPFKEHLGYDHPQGNDALRSAISLHVKQYKQINATPTSILITSGAQQALHLIVQSLLKPGDSIAIEDPSYCYSLPLFHSAGLHIHHLPVDEKGINPEDLVELHRKHRIRMVFVNPDYQNPTGTVLSQSRRKYLLEVSAKFGIPVVEDDPYSLTTFSGKINPTLKSMDLNGNVLYISSLTKIVASGLRIGWIIGPTPVIQRLADVKQQVDFGHSVFPQWIARNFLEFSDFDIHIQTLRSRLEQRKNLLVNSFNELVGDKVEMIIPNGGIHMWCKINTLVDDKLLIEEALKRGVAFAPGSIFGTKREYLRFTFGRCELDKIDEGISRFQAALKDAMQ